MNPDPAGATSTHRPRATHGRWMLSLALGVTALAVVAPTFSTQLQRLASLCVTGAMQVVPADLWYAWSLSPWTLIPLALLLVARSRFDDRRALAANEPPATAPQQLAFMLGWTALALALVSPLCRMAATLVSAHMIQHLVLVIVAPVLLAASLPIVLRRDRMMLATVLYGLAIWIWHAPPVYAALVTDPAAHLLGYLLLTTIACGFWIQVVRAAPDGRAKAPLALLATAMHTTLLGALLSFSPRSYYPVLADGAAMWGMEPLQDQQLAGLIMWIPGGVAYMAIALWLGVKVLGLRDEVLER
jgi:putative membrane protein